jgi:hypothetical protein
MPTEDARKRLIGLASAAREGAARFPPERAAGPPAPGDLFVLAATSGLPVEWAVLDRRTGRPGFSGKAGELLVVPADTQPLTGSADVEVPAGAPGGPLSLRCGFGIWVDAGLFAAATRSGALSPETVAEALQRSRRVDAGTLEPSPLAEEVDADPEYEDWIRDVPKQARDLILATRRTEVRPSRPFALEGYRLAALFALLAIGLSVWVVQLRREVEALSEPVFEAPGQEVNLGEQTRGSHTIVKLPRDARRVILDLALDSALPDQPGRFEIADAEERVVWQGPVKRHTPGTDVHLGISRELLSDGEYRLRLVPAAGGPAWAESILDVESGN